MEQTPESAKHMHPTIVVLEASRVRKTQEPMVTDHEIRKLQCKASLYRLVGLCQESVQRSRDSCQAFVNMRAANSVQCIS
jgi:hypothetical protein